MAPDLNSLPPSLSPSNNMNTISPTNSNTMPERGDLTTLRAPSPSPSPRGSTSLQAAAALNAGLQHEESSHSSHSPSSRHHPSNSGRRQSVLHNLHLNDPTLPAPGEMIGDPQSNPQHSASPNTHSPVIRGREPHHSRAPSLGELHQELEQEQEAQVNRLLQQIRIQQQQLQQLQAAGGQSHALPPAIDESTPTSERSLSFSNHPPLPHHHSSTSTPRSPSVALHPRSSFDLARNELHRRSRTPSRTASPRLRATSTSGEGGETWNLAGRDESAYYQAETQTMIRENQMLRQRIRELERQVSESHGAASITHEPAIPSQLLRSSSVSEEATSEKTGI